MKPTTLTQAIALLSENFRHIQWRYLANTQDKVQLWPGNPEEEIMVCVYNGRGLMESFHMQDFFFLNFAYKGQYQAFSERFDNQITIHEGECYIGQPHAGYAILGQSEKDITIVGILIQKHSFFKKFFHILSSDSQLFHFFLKPQINQFSDEYIHLKFEEDFAVRHLLELMMVEYATPQKNTQTVLQSLAIALLMKVAQQYAISKSKKQTQSLVENMVQYIGAHMDDISLKSLSKQFHYHPNYISALLAKTLNRTFSEIVLEQRMQRAVALLQGSSLSVSEIASLLGYSNSSNFHKAFRSHFQRSPREWQKQMSQH